MRGVLILSVISLLLLIVSVCGLPAILEESKDKTPSVQRNAFASEASQLIATQLLKFNIDVDANQVYSPLGLASILAILSEGASGETYTELINVLGYPKIRSDLRNSFKNLLTNYQKHDYTSSSPSFQTWLYIYRNNSAKNEFKQIVHDNYFVEVKEISRDKYDWSEPNTSLDLNESSDLSSNSASSSESSNSKDVIGFETLKRIKLDDDADQEEVSASTASAAAAADNYGEEVLTKESSKFDRFVDDKQYVEKPVALAEIIEKKEDLTTEKNLEEAIQAAEVTETIAELEKPAKDAAAVASSTKTAAASTNAAAASPIADDINRNLNVEENETVQVEEKLEKTKIAESGNITLAINGKDANEIVKALDTHLTSIGRAYGARSLLGKNDVSAALSANSITGRKAESKTKMLLFNGFYFRSNWANPFYELNNNEDEFFFMTKEDALKTPMMHSKGQFHVVDLEHLNARILCLPYQNKKYALSIILPNDPEGLNAVIEKLKPNDFLYAKTKGKLLDLHVTLPKFQIEETSRSEAMFKSIGLKKLFSRTEADLSLISEDSDLHIDELVQFTNLRVDTAGFSVNSLSTGNSQGRTKLGESDLEKFEVNRPFIYFLMDCEEQFVLASGKVFVPEYKTEPIISIDVELEQA